MGQGNFTFVLRPLLSSVEKVLCLNGSLELFSNFGVLKHDFFRVKERV
jgi:hypothetical protein